MLEFLIMKRYAHVFVAIPLGLFAALTFYLSTSVILDLFGVRESEGQYVLFVVWANWICSLIYFAAIYGILKKKRWPVYLLVLTVVILLLAEVGLQIHIYTGGAYERKTVFALLFRAGVSGLFAWVLHFFRGRQVGH